MAKGDRQKPAWVERLMSRTGGNAKALGIGAVVGVAIIGIGVSSGYNFMTTAKVPKVSGLAYTEALEELHKSGFSYINEERQTSDDVPLEAVISVTKEGKRVKPTEFITLFVSSGQEVFVPDVVGMSEEAAKLKLEENNCTHSMISLQCSDIVAKGNVISQEPVGGTSVTEADNGVRLWVSAGSQDEIDTRGFDCPDYVGKNFDVVKKNLAEFGVVVEEKQEFSDTLSEGIIIYQDVAIGQRIYKGDTITFIVSKGSEKKPEVTPETPKPSNGESSDTSATSTSTGGNGGNSGTSTSSTGTGNGGSSGTSKPSTTTDNEGSSSTTKPSNSVTLADYVQTDYRDAQKRLNDMGIGTYIEWQESGTVPEGAIIAQLPTAGETVSKGSDVKLYVSSGNPKFLLQDYTRAQFDVIRDSLESMGMVVTYDLEYTSEEKEGLILSQTPNAGIKVRIGDTIKFVVSEPVIGGQGNNQTDSGDTPEIPIEEENDYKITVWLDKDRINDSRVEFFVDNVGYNTQIAPPDSNEVTYEYTGDMQSVSVQVDGEAYANYTVKCTNCDRAESDTIQFEIPRYNNYHVVVKVNGFNYESFDMNGEAEPEYGENEPEHEDDEAWSTPEESDSDEENDIWKMVEPIAIDERDYIIGGEIETETRQVSYYGDFGDIESVTILIDGEASDRYMVSHTSNEADSCYVVVDVPDDKLGQELIVTVKDVNYYFGTADDTQVRVCIPLSEEECRANPSSIVVMLNGVRYPDGFYRLEASQDETEAEE